MNRGIWHLVNLTAPDAANPYIKPSVPTIHELVSKRQEKAAKLYNYAYEYWESTDPTLRQISQRSSRSRKKMLRRNTSAL